MRSLWPGVRWGDLLMSREGVRVRAGVQHIHKSVAETSTLYFTYRRAYRDVSDLSHGWGHNSQWRTALRRFYCTAESFHYNVDGKHDLRARSRKPDRDGLTPGERHELLVHRCFVRCEKPSGDLWPYDDTLVESRFTIDTGEHDSVPPS